MWYDIGLSPVDTGVPYCLLMLRNDFNDFAFEHWSGCCATEPGYAGDIGAIEIWLIDWWCRSPCKDGVKIFSLFCGHTINARLLFWLCNHKNKLIKFYLHFAAMKWISALKLQ